MDRDRGRLRRGTEDAVDDFPAARDPRWDWAEGFDAANLPTDALLDFPTPLALRDVFSNVLVIGRTEMPVPRGGGSAFELGADADVDG